MQPSTAPMNARSEIRSLFEKKFRYTKLPNWHLPPANELFKEYYQYENFQQLKHDLNAVKSKLNDYVLEDWSSHTRRKDPCSEIPWKLKSEIKAEFVTVAWCKLFECLHQYPIVKSGKLNSLHLCEAPGAFITALNHYLQSTYDEVQWNWLSTTLNPYYEGNPLTKMIIDDRFMLHTLNKWLFHEDFSGNIMDRQNIENMSKQCKIRLGEVHFITADGSVDCTETPDNQEEEVSTLHFAEACAALYILAKGGSFVLKMFTLFEALSVSLLYFLNCIFEDVNVFKPATSKRGNSESYIICLGFLKPENINDYLNPMMDKVNTPKIFPLFPKRFIPTDFCVQHEVCARRFMHEQMIAIESNIYSYIMQCRRDNKIKHELRSEVSKHFIDLYKVKPIPLNKTVLLNLGSKIEHGIHNQIYHGSYTERQCVKNLSIEQQVFFLRKDLNDIERNFLWQYDEMACFQRTPDDQLPIKLYEGRPLEELRSSLFASVGILVLRTKFATLNGKDPLFENDPHCALSDGSKLLRKINIDNDLSNNFAQKQQEFFSNVLQAIIKHKPKTVSFVNFPFLSHYSVSILRYLAANVFKSCRINGTRDIILENAQWSEEEIESIRELLNLIVKSLRILCFVDILHLHRNHFSNVISNFNNQILLHNYRVRLNAK